MATPPIQQNDIVQVVIESRCEGQTLLNVLHYRAIEPAGSATYAESLVDLMTKLSGPDGVTVRMTPLMGPNARVTNIQAQRVWPERYVYLRQPLNEQGEGLEDCDAINVAAVVVKQGEEVGRGKSGTFHLGGLSSDTYALGFLTEATMNALVALGNVLDNKLNGIEGPADMWEPGMFSPTGSPGENWNPVVGCIPRDTLRILRRRTVGVGI